MAQQYFFYLRDLITTCKDKASEFYFYPLKTNYRVKVAGSVLRIAEVSKSFHGSNIILSNHLTKIFNPTTSCILELSEEQFDLINDKVPIEHLNLYNNVKFKAFLNRKKVTWFESVCSYIGVTF